MDVHQYGTCVPNFYHLSDLWEPFSYALIAVSLETHFDSSLISDEEIVFLIPYSIYMGVPWFSVQLFGCDFPHDKTKVCDSQIFKGWNSDSILGRYILSNYGRLWGICGLVKIVSFWKSRIATALNYRSGVFYHWSCFWVFSLWLKNKGRKAKQNKWWINEWRFVSYWIKCSTSMIIIFIFHYNTNSNYIIYKD